MDKQRLNENTIINYLDICKVVIIIVLSMMKSEKNEIVKISRWKKNLKL